MPSSTRARGSSSWTSGAPARSGTSTRARETGSEAQKISDEKRPLGSLSGQAKGVLPHPHKAERFGGHLQPTKAKNIEDGKEAESRKSSVHRLSPAPDIRAALVVSGSGGSAFLSFHRLESSFHMVYNRIFNKNPKSRCSTDAGERVRRLGNPQAGRVPRPSGSRFPRLHTQENSLFRPMAA